MAQGRRSVFVFCVHIVRGVDLLVTGRGGSHSLYNIAELAVAATRPFIDERVIGFRVM